MTEHWFDQAACGSKPELFVVVDRELKNGEGFNKWKSYDKDRFAKAIKICRKCPVQQECGESASPEDFKWTIRAARMPTAFRTRLAGRPTSAEKAARKPGECANGHVGHYVQWGKKKVCRECSRLRAARRRVREGVLPVIKGDTCRNGHKGFYGESGGKRYCRMCRSVSEAKRRQSAKIGE